MSLDTRNATGDEPVDGARRRPPLRILRTSTFRLALVYMALFGGSALVLTGFLYWATAGSLLRQSDATIGAEVEGLAEQYRQRGTRGLVQVIEARIERDPSSPSLYLFADARFRRLAGNLSGWPNVAPRTDEAGAGWVDFQLEDRVRGGEVHRARARVFTLSGGYRLLVGRDMYEIDRLRASFVRAATWGVVLVGALALIGGILMSRGFLRRIEAINETSRQIMDGDLGRRVPAAGVGDELDRLAMNLNRMLDRIELLMDGVRRVSDHIAHDLRTPLSRIRGRLERLHDRLESADGIDDESRALAAESLDEADRLLRVFRALLRIARIEAGGARPADQTFDLMAVARDAVELYEAAAEAKQQRLALVEGEAVPVRGDRDLVFQALVNLLDNAIKYTPEGGVVRVAVTVAERRASIAVADSGPGVPAEAHGTVLERFGRLDRDRRLPGEGLGLALVAAVARHHGGDLTLGDAHPGLEAVLELPRGQPSTARDTARA